MNPEDPYTDPETGVLYNKLGLRSAEELQAAERDITWRRAREAADNPPAATYDLDHLRAIHRRLFSDLYDWAGELRSVDLAKTDLFCRPQFISDQARQLFGRLAADRYLRGLPRDRFVDAAAHYLGEINALHPFREGNGRAQRAFIAQLAADAGHPVDWADLDEAENVAASLSSLRGDPGPLRLLLDRHVTHAGAAGRGCRLRGGM